MTRPISNWGNLGVEVVAEATGLFLTEEMANKHLEAGAKKVVMTGPSKDDTPMFVLGVNSYHLCWPAHHLQRLLHHQLHCADRKGSA